MCSAVSWRGCLYANPGEQRAHPYMLPRSRSSSLSSAANANHLQPARYQRSSHPKARQEILFPALSTAVNATYSEVTARTRVCLHIDITAGRDSGDRDRDGGGGGSGEGESRDLIPSKLSPRICPPSVRRDMVMPPLRCSAVSRSAGGLAALGGQIKSRGKEGDRHAHALSRSSLCHRSDTAPLPKLQ